MSVCYWTVLIYIVKDFNSTGTYIASGSIDHSIKIWCIDKPEIRKATEDSYKFCIAKSAGLV